ncbi:MAG: amidohydrolase family protein [Pirellulales bacterium]
MTANFNRRAMLAGVAAAPWLVSQGVAAAEQASPRRANPTMDIHVHLFGVGDNASGCRLSKTILEAPTFQLLLAKLRLRERAKTLDEGYVLALAEQLGQSGLDKGLVLAQDAVYDASGQPDWTKTHFYVPNDYLFEVVARYPQWMIPCVSINPARADALAELDRCRQRGARMLKIHPPIQGVDLADKRYTPFFDRCVELKMLVMVHTGYEHSAPVFDPALANPRKLELALDRGCTVIASHCGTGRPADRPDMLPDFLAMARSHENLWGDTSVLGGFQRERGFLRLLAEKPVLDRLLHGSDFPFPALPLSFAKRLGMAEALRLQAIPNLIQQDLALKEALGIGLASAERAHRLVVG